MPFNVQRAYEMGGTDESIAGYLAKTRGYDLDWGLKNGYSHKEIVDFLSTQDVPGKSPVEKPIPAPKALVSVEQPPSTPPAIGLPPGISPEPLVASHVPGVSMSKPQEVQAVGEPAPVISPKQKQAMDVSNRAFDINSMLFGTNEAARQAEAVKKQQAVDVSSRALDINAQMAGTQEAAQGLQKQQQERAKTSIPPFTPGIVSPQVGLVQKSLAKREALRQKGEVLKTGEPSLWTDPKGGMQTFAESQIPFIGQLQGLKDWRSVETGMELATLMASGEFLGEAGRAISRSTWFRKLMIPERGLIALSADDMAKQGMSEGQILRNLNNPTFRKDYLAKYSEALGKRTTGEGITPEPIQPSPQPSGEPPISPVPQIPVPTPQVRPGTAPQSPLPLPTRVGGPVQGQGFQMQPVKPTVILRKAGNQPPSPVISQPPVAPFGMNVAPVIPQPIPQGPVPPMMDTPVQPPAVLPQVEADQPVVAKNAPTQEETPEQTKARLKSELEPQEDLKAKYLAVEKQYSDALEEGPKSEAKALALRNQLTALYPQVFGERRGAVRGEEPINFEKKAEPVKEPVVEEAKTEAKSPEAVPAEEAPKGEVVQPVPEGGVKEPWKITKEEFIESNVRLKPAVKVDGKLFIGKPGQIHAQVEIPPKVLENAHDTTLGFIDENGEWSVSGGTRPEASTLRREQFLKHKEIVKQAFSEGKPVPPEVLVDYPDLAPEPVQGGAEVPKEVPVSGEEGKAEPPVVETGKEVQTKDKEAASKVEWLGKANEYKKGDKVVPSIHPNSENFGWMINSQFENNNIGTVLGVENLAGVDYVKVKYLTGRVEIENADRIARVKQVETGEIGKRLQKEGEAEKPGVEGSKGIATIRKERYSEKRGTTGSFHDVWRIYDDKGNKVSGVDFSSEQAAISRAKSIGYEVLEPGVEGALHTDHETPISGDIHAQVSAKPYETRGPVKSFIVDGEKIRNGVDKEFTNFASGQDPSKKYIPKDEVWIDRQSVQSDYPVLLDNVLKQHQLMSGGMSYDEALKRGDAIEKRERVRANSPKPADKKLSPRLVEDSKKEQLGTIGKEKTPVWLVDGDKIREVSPDFVEGGNDQAYPWMPKDTIIIDDQIAPEERQAVIVHEATERNRMLKGMTYPEAHKLSSADEHEYRENPENKKFDGVRIAPTENVAKPQESGLLPEIGTPSVETLSKLQKNRKVTLGDRAKEFYQPGNIIYNDYWHNYDKVVNVYGTPGEGDWKVQVQEVNRDGTPKPGTESRWHKTMPTKGDRIEKEAPSNALPPGMTSAPGKISPAVNVLPPGMEKVGEKPKKIEDTRISVRPSNYRGKDGFVVSGTIQGKPDQSIFFEREADAVEFKQRVKDGESSDEVASEIFGRAKEVEATPKTVPYSQETLDEAKRQGIDVSKVGNIPKKEVGPIQETKYQKYDDAPEGISPEVWKTAKEYNDKGELTVTDIGGRRIVTSYSTYQTKSWDGQTGEEIGDLWKLKGDYESEARYQKSLFDISQLPDVEGKKVEPAKERKVETIKDQKKYLVDAIDEAIKVAPEEAVEPVTVDIPQQSTYGGPSFITKPIMDKTPHVIVEVPGDGTFRVINSKGNLERFKQAVKDRFPEDNKIAKPESIKKTSEKPTGRRIQPKEDLAYEYVSEYKPKRVSDADYVSDAASLVGQGWFTNGQYAVKGEPPQGFGKKNTGKYKGELTKEALDGITPSLKSMSPATHVAEYHLMDQKINGAMAISDKAFAYFNPAYMDIVKKYHPDSVLYILAETSPMAFVEGKEIVAVMMPMRGDDNTGAITKYFEDLGGKVPWDKTTKEIPAEEVEDRRVPLRSNPQNVGDVTLELVNIPEGKTISWGDKGWKKTSVGWIPIGSNDLAISSQELASRIAKETTPKEEKAVKAEEPTVKVGDTVTATPSSDQAKRLKYFPVEGQVQEVIHNQEGKVGYHIVDKNGDVQRVWAKDYEVGPKKLTEMKKGDILPNGYALGEPVRAAHKAGIYEGFVGQSDSDNMVYVVDAEGEGVGNFPKDRVSRRGETEGTSSPGRRTEAKKAEFTRTTPVKGTPERDDLEDQAKDLDHREEVAWAALDDVKTELNRTSTVTKKHDQLSKRREKLEAESDKISKEGKAIEDRHRTSIWEDYAETGDPVQKLIGKERLKLITGNESYAQQKDLFRDKLKSMGIKGDELETAVNDAIHNTSTLSYGMDRVAEVAVASVRAPALREATIKEIEALDLPERSIEKYKRFVRDASIWPKDIEERLAEAKREAEETGPGVRAEKARLKKEEKAKEKLEAQREASKISPSDILNKPSDPKKFYLYLRPEAAEAIGEPTNWKEVSGKPVKIDGFEDFDLFVHRGLETGWSVSEGKSGLSVVPSTKKHPVTSQGAAIEQAKKVLKSVGKAKLQETIDKNIDKMGEISPRWGKPKTESKPSPPSPEVEVEPTEGEGKVGENLQASASGEGESDKITDFGEKVGGARKDIAERGFTMSKTPKTEEGPAWKKRFVAAESVHTPGQWTIIDTKVPAGIYSRRGQVFSSQEDAEKAIPLYAVARNHDVYPNRDNTYSIVKKVSDRKRLKIVNKDFTSREEAMTYMATHAEDILNTKTTFGEEILPVPDKVVRKGVERRTKDATSEMFMETFAPRGIEFGNWNNQEERQLVMNHAYDALLDLSDVLNIPPKALMLNGELAIAFGARGQGLSGAKAHYEPDYGIINLTKMKGAGSTGHELFHALDHYLGRLDTKAKSEKVTNERGNLVYPSRGPTDFLSHGASYKSELRPELREAYKNIIDTMYSKAQQYVEDTKKADEFLGKARENLKTKLDEVRSELSRDLTNYHKSKGGYSGKSIKYFEPASAEQLSEFDRLANILVEGGDLETSFRYNKNVTDRPGEKDYKPKGISKAEYGRVMAGRHSNDTLDGMNSILKAARGRQGFSKEQTGQLDRVRAAMNTYKERLKMFDDAQKGTEKTKKVPTSYAIEAKKMDQARSGDYWSEPHEMAARAFASYVEDKIAEQGGQSDFLVYQAHGGILLPMIDGFVARPYPEGAEREAINNAFDKFVKTLKTKGEGGKILYGALPLGLGLLANQMDQKKKEAQKSSYMPPGLGF